MKPKIYIRVNAEKNKGLGHWVRCIALADMLKGKFECAFLLQTENQKIADQTRTKGFTCYLIPSSINLSNEVKYLRSHYLKGDEILVLDGYSFNGQYQKAIKKNVGKLVCIDDIHATHFYADVVINHAGGIKASDYSCTSTTKLCLGLDYLLLRKEFFQDSKFSSQYKNDFDRLLICMGGEDPNNDTLKVLKQCEQISNINNCEVVIGSGYAYKKNLEEFVRKSKLNICISQSLNADQLFKKMSTCSSAICSPSTMALEYLSISGNLFLHQTAENQKYLYQYFLSNGLAFPLSSLAIIKKHALKEARVRQQSLIDGKSPHRIITLFENLQLVLNLKFRLAKRGDLYQYFIWTNDASTRQQSFQSAPISFLEHLKWFKNQLSCQSSVLIVMEWQKKSIGQIRFSIKNDTATISYSLDNKFRGKGLARQLITGGINFLISKHPEIKQIEGFVKLKNYQSIKAFRRMGFLEQKIQTPFKQLKYFQQLKKTG